MKKMRFFILILGFVSLFGFTKVLKAEDSVSIISITKMLDGALDGVQQDTDTSGGVVGGTLEYNPTIEHATFMFWVVNGAVRTDLPQNLTIRVTSKLDLVAHFASTDKYSVAFLDANTKLLGVNFVDTEGKLNIPSEPSRVGTDFLGWAPIANYDEATPESTPVNPGSKAYFVAKYKVTTVIKRTVIINGVPSEHILNEVVTATTTDADFSYWMDQDSGAILSYSQEYKFSVLDQDVNLVPVNEGAKTDPMVSIRISFNFKDDYDTFIGHYELDETKYELIEFGFLHDNKEHKFLSSSFNEETNEFMVSIPDSTTSGFIDNDYKMRAYLTYKVIATGEVITVKNQSRYEILFETTAPENAPDTIYLVGDFTGWSLSENYVTLAKGESEKYIASSPIVYEGEPGTELKYKYLAGLYWGMVEQNIPGPVDGDGNRLLRLGIIGSIGPNNSVDAFNNIPDPTLDDGKIRVYVQDVKPWDIDGFHLHIWGNGHETDWPGYEIEEFSTNGYWYIDIDMPPNADQGFGIKINWNNKTEETNNIDASVGTTFIKVYGRWDGQAVKVPEWDPHYVSAP